MRWRTLKESQTASDYFGVSLALTRMVLKQYIDGQVDVAVPVTGKSDVAVLQTCSWLQNKLDQRSPRQHGNCRKHRAASRRGHAATRLKKGFGTSWHNSSALNIWPVN